MTGRKVTRRASMRRKSMRSPSVSRSSGSKTPRSFVSEPHTSGKNSFNNSLEKLDLTAPSGTEDQTNSLANNSTDRLSKSSERVLSYAAVAKPESNGTSSTEALVEELAAVKIAASKDNLPQEVSNSENISKTSLNASKASLNAASNKGSIAELAKNRSTTSLNEKSSNTQLNRSNSRLDTKTSEEVKKSTEELVAVPLDAAEKNEEVEAKEEEEQVKGESNDKQEEKTETAGVAAETSADQQTGEIQTENSEETKKSCLAQKYAKCRCVIS